MTTAATGAQEAADDTARDTAGACPEVDEDRSGCTSQGPMLMRHRIRQASDASPPRSSVGQPRSGRTGAWPPSLTSTAAVPGPAGLWYADVPDRILAFVLDVIALAVVGLFLAIVIGGAFGGLISGGATAGGSLDAAQGDLNVGAFVVVAHRRDGDQLRLLRVFAGSRCARRRACACSGLAIGSTSATGDPSRGDQALIRWLVVGIRGDVRDVRRSTCPSLVGLVLAVLGSLAARRLLVTIGQEPDEQGLHDRYAASIVMTVVRRPVRRRGLQRLVHASSTTSVEDVDDEDASVDATRG